MPQSNISAPPLQGRPVAAHDVSIIIVSWNVREALAGCLLALTSGGATGSLTTELIVVDNASHDGSAELAAKFDNVRVVRSARNLGYGRANNVGLRLAGGKHLLILNPDTVPLAGSIERLVRFQRARPAAGIVSPRLLNADGSLQPAAYRFPTLLMAALDIFPLPTILPGRLRQRVYNSRLNGRYPDEGRRSAPFRIDHPLGACMLLSREAFEKAGGFDTRLFMYSEEIDLALRYKALGWECWQLPSAQVMHLGGESTKQIPDEMYVQLWRSRLYLYRKHYPLVSRVALSFLALIGQISALLALLARLLLGKATQAEARRTLNRVSKTLRLVFAR